MALKFKYVAKYNENLVAFWLYSWFNFSHFIMCEHCLYGKQTQSPHKRGNSRKIEPLALVQSNVCGTMPMLSMGEGASFVIFIEKFSCKV